MTNGVDTPSTAMPDEFDRKLALFHGLPGVVKTRSAQHREVPTLGVGGTKLYTVSTVRIFDKMTIKKGKHQGQERTVSSDIIFLEVFGAGQPVRIWLPGEVSDIIVRQRDSLTKMSRKKIAKAEAQRRKDLGIKPGFMRKKK